MFANIPMRNCENFESNAWYHGGLTIILTFMSITTKKEYLVPV